MANRYANLIGTNKIKDEYIKINEGFDEVQEEQDAQNTKMQNHIAGTADKHKAEDVNYTGNVPNATNLKEGLDNLHDRVEQIITTPIEGVSAQEIIDARKGKTTLRAKIDEIDSQLAEKANVIRYGADNTGVADSTDAFIAAINAIKTLEYTENIPSQRVTKMLYIPGGVYKISAKITVPSYIHIKGDGRHVTFLDSYITNGDPVFEIINSGSNLQFYNTLEGFTINGRSQNCIGIKMSKVARWIVRDVLINLTNHEGIYLYQSYLGDISSLFLRGCGDSAHDSMVLDGPDAPNGCHAITITGGELAGGHRNGLCLKYGASVSLFGTTIEGFRYGAGIINENSYSLNVQGCYFELNKEHIVETGTTFSSNYCGNYFAVLADGGRGHIGITHSLGAKIEGNYFETPSSVKIFDATNDDSVRIYHSSIRNNLSQSYPLNVSTSLLDYLQRQNGNIFETFNGAFDVNIYGQIKHQNDVRFAAKLKPEGGIHDISGWGVSITAGAISPEGNVTANPGSLYIMVDGGRIFVKKAGTDNTGWSEITVV